VQLPARYRRSSLSRKLAGAHLVAATHLGGLSARLEQEEPWQAGLCPAWLAALDGCTFVQLDVASRSHPVVAPITRSPMRRCRSTHEVLALSVRQTLTCRLCRTASPANLVWHTAFPRRLNWHSCTAVLVPIDTTDHDFDCAYSGMLISCFMRVDIGLTCTCSFTDSRREDGRRTEGLYQLENLRPFSIRGNGGAWRGASSGWLVG
jgi:hypothetical protein